MCKTEAFIPFARPDIGEEEIEAASSAMRSGWLTTGSRALEFERAFASHIGPDVQAVAVNSATAGMHLALEALGVGPGDEVLVPTWTFTATAEVVRYMGADPILVDVDRATLNLDLQAAEAAVTPRTRAVMPVHFAGLSVSRTEVESFARRNELLVVEDAAHAFPATSGGVTVGAGNSDAVVFSFYATKTITTGEGGMLVTRRSGVAERARTMRLHGISSDVFDRYSGRTPAWQYQVVAPGFKYNLTDPAAAIGLVQLSRAIQMRERRAEIARRYDDAFQSLPLRLPAHSSGEDIHAWHLYVVRLEPDTHITRDEFIERLGAAGVGCSVHFIPLHLQPFWRDRASYKADSFPVATEEFRYVVSLPIYSGMTDPQIDRVISAACGALID